MKKILKKIATFESALRFYDEDGNITDVNDCEISSDERSAGINIKDLVGE
jgi:hypothetical protein